MDIVHLFRPSESSKRTGSGSAGGEIACSCVSGGDDEVNDGREKDDATARHRQRKKDASRKTKMAVGIFRWVKNLRYPGCLACCSCACFNNGDGRAASCRRGGNSRNLPFSTRSMSGPSTGDELLEGIEAVEIERLVFRRSFMLYARVYYTRMLCKCRDHEREN